MPQRAETKNEILLKNKTDVENNPSKDKRMNLMKWNLLLSILLSIITGSLAGYLAATGLINETPNTQINVKTIDFTKKIAIDNPTITVIDNLTKQIVGVYAVNNSANWGQNLFTTDDLLGTALVVTSDGWLMTTDKVITDLKKEYQIITSDKKTFKASGFIQDKLTGLVFFKIDARNLVPAQFAETDQIVRSQSAILMAADSNPYDPKVKMSNLEELNYYFQKTAKDNFHSTEKQDQFFLLADILPDGFAGGVASSLNGEIIGLVNVSVKNENFPTLIPSSYLSRVVKNVLTDQTKVRLNYLGVVYLDLSENLNLPDNLTAGKNKGCLLLSNADLQIQAIKKDSPAKSVLQEGDIILAVDGQELNEKNNFTRIIQDYPAKSKIKLLILRKGTEKEVEVTLALQ